MKHDALRSLIKTRVESCPDGRVWSYRLGYADRCDTYGDLWQRSAVIAGGLVESGVSACQPVVLLTRDVVDFVPAFWACLRAGGMAVPLIGLASELLPARRDTALREALSRLAQPIVLYDATFAEIAGSLQTAGDVKLLSLVRADASSPLDEERACAEPPCLIPTSGSTGRLKLVALGQEALLNRPMSVAPCQEAQPSTTLSLFPFDTISGMRVLFLTCDTWVHLPLPTFAGHPLSALDAIERHRATTLSITNSLADMLGTAVGGSERSWDLSSLCRVLSGSERVVPAVMRRLRDVFRENGAPSARIIANYGTTETALLVAGADPLASGSADDSGGATPLGRSAEGVELRIVDDNGSLLGEGEIGEVQAFCSGAIFSGYWGEPEATRSGFTGDGWWRTGDQGSLCEGALTLYGRTKEIVIVNGRKHSLADIDAHLQTELGSAVRAYSCAVHMPDEPSERLVVVFVAIDPRADNVAITELIRSATGRRFGIHALPLSAPSMTAIPVTGAGKIRRQELAQHVRTGAIGRPTPGA